MEMMSGPMGGERGADRGGTASGFGIKVASNMPRASDLEAKVKALEAQIQRQEERSRRQEERWQHQEERWQRKFESLLQRIEAKRHWSCGCSRLSNDKKDSEQRQKKTEWTSTAVKAGAEEKAAKKKTKAQMQGASKGGGGVGGRERRRRRRLPTRTRNGNRVLGGTRCHVLCEQAHGDNELEEGKKKNTPMFMFDRTSRTPLCSVAGGIDPQLFLQHLPARNSATRGCFRP